MTAIKSLPEVPESMAQLGRGTIPFDERFYPFEWAKDERPNFERLQKGLLVAPILQKLLLNREPERVLAWVEAVSKYPFNRIIPAHLQNDIRAGPNEFKAAF